jgi:pimeloyl-ACP methyl ester carboxylesterase
MVVETKSIPVSGDREICLEIGGHPSGVPVLVHNGTPNSRHLYEAWLLDAESKGICLISYDRPGYGGSTAYPDHTVASGANDVRAIAESLGLDRLCVWGISGGGPYALACAALLTDLVVAVGAVASLAPYGQSDLAYFEGMGERNMEDIQLFFSDREAARRKGYEDWEEFIAASPEQLAEGLKSLLCPADAQMLSGELADWLARSAHDGLAPGDQGWWDDGVSHLTDWGFELSAITTPTKVWHGRQDHFVPVQHGEWLAANIPSAEAEISDNDGHLTWIGRIGEVHDWLLGHFYPEDV